VSIAARPVWLAVLIIDETFRVSRRISSRDSYGPDAMPLLIERDLASLAYHQNIAELRCGDGCSGAAALADLLILIYRLIRWQLMPKNRSEREQPRVLIEHNASVDLRDALEHSRREFDGARLSQKIIELVLRACSLSRVGFEQVEPAHKLMDMFRTFQDYEHASAPMFGKIESGGEQPRGEISAPDRGLPGLILRDSVREAPTSVEEIE
jgi:hypothetical protein